MATVCSRDRGERGRFLSKAVAASIIRETPLPPGNQGTVSPMAVVAEPVDLSLVIPMRNEEDNVVPLYEEIRDVLEATDLTWECILVDDGSTDRTVERAIEAFSGDSRLEFVRLRKNSGQTAGLAAGFERANGRLIATMDGDLQNDPHDIPAMIAKLDEGYDLISGWRKNRQDKLFSRKLPSRIANRLISKFTWTPIQDFGCAMKVYRREALEDVSLYGEMHRFLPALCVWKGARIAEMAVNHRARIHGSSNYGLVRTIKVLLDLVTVKFLNDYLGKPLYFFAKVAFGTTVAAVAMLLTAGLQRFGILWVGSNPPPTLTGNPLMHLGLILMGITVQIVLFGVISELLVRIYHESQGKRPFRVREIIRMGDRSHATDDA
ncbi:MAG: glycosyltransferase family 2 protein [Planctomycetota bacterium]